MPPLTSLRAFSTLAARRSGTLFRPHAPLRSRIPRASLATTRPLLVDRPVFGKDFEKEREALRQEKIKPNPENVSSTSTETPMRDFGRSAQGAPPGPNMEAALEHDLHVVKETLALDEVPKEVYWFGLGGTIPYAITSATTLYLAWDLNYMKSHGMGYLVSKETAESLLHVLEPIQVGYGAVILSFLGAIHWGLEFAKYGGSHPKRRYFLGVLAPVLAWPTVMLPLDYALLTQFVGFTGMYFADSQATTRGWAPKWYTTYRFILTFIVGVSIVSTLVGRGKIGPEVEYGKDARDKFAALREEQRSYDPEQAKLLAEEKAVKRNRAKKQKEEEEGKEKKADPGKEAAKGQQGKQGKYSDEYQNKDGEVKREAAAGQPTEGGSEKKGEQKPMEDKQKFTGMKG